MFAASSAVEKKVLVVIFSTVVQSPPCPSSGCKNICSTRDLICLITSNLVPIHPFIAMHQSMGTIPIRMHQGHTCIKQHRPCQTTCTVGHPPPTQKTLSQRGCPRDKTSPCRCIFGLMYGTWD